MPYTAIASTDVDAKSPITDDLMGDLAANDAYLKSALTDGASASQALTVSSVTIKAAGTALTVDNNAAVTGDLTVSGNLSVGTFFSSEQLLFLMA